jgi:hypothetical protein
MTIGHGSRQRIVRIEGPGSRLSEHKEAWRNGREEEHERTESTKNQAPVSEGGELMASTQWPS